MRIGRGPALILGFLSLAAAVSAQEAVPEYPNVRAGGVLFTDFTYQAEPRTQDADGNAIHPSSFNVTRAYVNLFGNLSRVISGRITGDVVRDTNAADSALFGNNVYRLKFAYLQFALDDWIGKGGLLRFGLQNTPYITYVEDVYRYRFQGPLFVDREGLLVSSDAGICARYAFASDYGDVVAGVFNGEGYNHSETNDQKALQVRASVRPMPRHPVLSGLRFAVFGDWDHYQGSDAKDRFIGVLTFENPGINVGLELAETRDRPLASAPEARGRGYSVWATPRTPFGLEALLRYDHARPDRDAAATRTRAIAGVAYWFPLQKGVTTAVMIDYEKDRYAHFVPARATEERYSLHTLFSF